MDYRAKASIACTAYCCTGYGGQEGRRPNDIICYNIIRTPREKYVAENAKLVVVDVLPLTMLHAEE